MKNSIFVAAIAACALSASVVSAQEKYPPSQPARTDKAMNMDMSKQTPQMQENMKKMQKQMLHKQPQE